jgi:hypothetical protein
MTGDAAIGDAATPKPEPLLQVICGSPTPRELAAVAAVIEGMALESASLRRQATDAGPSDWQLSRRPTAVPIVPSRGAWNRSRP